MVRRHVCCFEGVTVLEKEQSARRRGGCSAASKSALFAAQMVMICVGMRSFKFNYFNLYKFNESKEMICQLRGHVIDEFEIQSALIFN
jgi:hypothetical protein